MRNEISRIRREIVKNGFSNITPDQYNRLQAEWIVRCCGDVAEEEITKLKQENLEKIVKWSMGLGFATGHADSIDDLLSELEWQIKEVLGKHKQDGEL